MAASLAFAAALIFLLGICAAAFGPAFPLILAHLARAAAAILAREAELSFLLVCGAATAAAGAEAPRTRTSSV